MIIDWGKRTFVMGILNATPDSFSGDGLYSNSDILSRAVTQAQRFVAEGADIIDIGGESTRPGSTPITVAEELERVLPVISAIHESLPVPLSIDTYRASVAEAALNAGATWVNDVWGLRMDPNMAEVVARKGCMVVLMHNRSKPKNVSQEKRLGGRYVGVGYSNLIEDIQDELRKSIDLALEAGVEPSKIVIDPGVGFGKTVDQNLQLIQNLHRFKELGFPILLGPSRKSFIGYSLDLPPKERLGGTAATIAIGIDRGADIVRIHDVKEIVRVARMTDKIIRS